MKFAVFGAGLIGGAITSLLCKDPEVTGIVLLDHNGNALADATEHLSGKKFRAHRVSTEQYDNISALVSDVDVIISALPPHQNYRIARLASKLGINYLDLGGSDSIVEKQLELEERAKSHHCWIIPNAGLVPGMLNVLTETAVKEFSEIENIQIRAGGLPLHPEEPFKFQLIFTPITLINEYTEPVWVIKDGIAELAEPMTGYEKVTVSVGDQQMELEAFRVSGRITTLVKHLEGKVKNLEYKALRNIGHKSQFDALNKLGFFNDQIVDVRSGITYRSLLERQMRKNIPQGKADFALGQVIIEGKKEGRNVRKNLSISHIQPEDGHLSAIVELTANSTIVMAKMVAKGHIQGPGGIVFPEVVIDGELFKEELSKANINIIDTEEDL